MQIGLGSGDSGQFELRSSSGLVLIEDPDDGLKISVGETIAADLGFPNDLDYFTIRLERGETVEIATESLYVDTYVLVDFLGSRNDQVVGDDDTGGGIFGVDAQLIYQAPQSGTYHIEVGNAVDFNHGGYFLSVRQAPAGAEPAFIPPSPGLVESQFGTMIVYQTSDEIFTINVPEDWIEQQVDPLLAEFSAVRNDGSNVTVVDEDTGTLGVDVTTLEAYTDLTVSLIEEAAGAEITSRQPTQTSQGLPATVLDISLLDGLILAKRLIYLNDEGIAFSITYVFPAAEFDAGKELADYSFDSFRVNYGARQSDHTHACQNQIRGRGPGNGKTVGFAGGRSVP